MLELLNFTVLVQQMAAAAMGAGVGLTDVTVGSPLLAIFEANASIGVWMQWLILQVLARTRLSSSIGPDVDTWVADFGLERGGATASSGMVTLSRNTTRYAATILPGSMVKSGDYTQTFTVLEDDSNVLWNAGLLAYILPAGIAAGDVPVQNTVAGTSGNVAAGTLIVPATNITGIDYVTNAAPFENGLDAESDAALKARFILYINTRSLATDDAIRFAVTSIAQNLTCVLQPNVPRIGAFTVVVDDGTGYPADATIAAVQVAVDAVRADTVQAIVAKPDVLPVSVAMTLRLVPGTSSAVAGTASAAATTALLNYINAQPVGAELAYLSLAAVAISAAPAILGVVANTYLLNDAANADIIAAPTQVVKATSASVVVSGS